VVPLFGRAWPDARPGKKKRSDREFQILSSAEEIQAVEKDIESLQEK
jgi:hypothetical protein